MYKDLRKKQVDIIIDVNNYEQTCGGCPTAYDFTDIDGTSYYFRLRYGGASIKCEDTGEVLISGCMNGFDGVCGWDDVVRWARNNGVVLNY